MLEDVGLKGLVWLVFVGPYIFFIFVYSNENNWLNMGDVKEWQIKSNKSV